MIALNVNHAAIAPGDDLSHASMRDAVGIVAPFRPWPDLVTDADHSAAAAVFAGALAHPVPSSDSDGAGSSSAGVGSCRNWPPARAANHAAAHSHEQKLCSISSRMRPSNIVRTSGDGGASSPTHDLPHSSQVVTGSPCMRRLRFMRLYSLLMAFP